jgi:transcription elongation factor GreA
VVSLGYIIPHFIQEEHCIIRGGEYLHFGHMRKSIPIQIPDPIPFTKEGFENLKKEQQELIVSRKDAVTDLSKARAMGDLSENGYYKAAKMKLSSIDNRLARLKYMIRYAKVSDTIKKETIDIGSTFVVNDGKIEKTFILVGGYESNPLEGKISHISPLGKALLGKRKGDTAIFKAPIGEITYIIKEIN